MSGKVTVRKLAKLIEKMVPAEPAVTYASLFYNPPEKMKDSCLKKKADQGTSACQTIHFVVDHKFATGIQMVYNIIVEYSE